MENKVIAFEGAYDEVDLFYLEGDTPVWGALYREHLSPATAAWDFEAILRGVNPAEAGWQLGEFDTLEEAKGAYSAVCDAIGGGSSKAAVLAEDFETYPDDTLGACGDMFLEALDMAKEVAMHRDFRVPATGKPKYALVSSSSWEDDSSPELDMVLNTMFFSDKESAVRAMALQLYEMLDEELSEDWDDNEYDSEIEKRGFSISGDSYCITEYSAWYSDEGDPEEPGAFKKVWKIVPVPSLV